MHSRIRSFPLPTRCLHHHHPYHQLVIALSGSAEFEIAGYGGRVDAMHGCLVPAGEVHFYEGLGRNRHVVMDFPLPSTQQELQRLFDRPRYFTADPSLRMLLGFLDREQQLWRQSADAVEGMSKVFLGSLYQRLFEQSPTLPQAPSRLDMVQLEVYIQQHLAEPLPVARLAEAACVSPGHFHELFRGVTGMTPGQYIVQARLERASDLLRETRLPMSAIAEEAGFASQSSLAHACQRHLGKTPGQIRSGH
ncbi:Helix-turn-helix domain-containing protein [Marinospirillum celere]|uniref:Helix-turn-helix domain-containing protein n=1 Tax=Marinospirillum celere TaxID=1122252 RepID=A0A1I1JM64_9GAMM|nr:AraC family transcriptional regulator [Marinospirillum celere]SFC49566.1 Helix-turn-helix domain-containing protein [Marinospirillum celere]